MIFFPGSSINEAHIQAENELGQLIREANQINRCTLSTLLLPRKTFIRRPQFIRSYPQKSIFIDDNEMNLYDGTGGLSGKPENI